MQQGENYEPLTLSHPESLNWLSGALETNLVNLAHNDCQDNRECHHNSIESIP